MGGVEAALGGREGGGRGGARYLVYVDDKLLDGLKSHVAFFFEPGLDSSISIPNTHCMRTLVIMREGGEAAHSTRGRLMDSSKPSRLMVSINTPICSSPRPPTSYLFILSHFFNAGTAGLVRVARIALLHCDGHVPLCLLHQPLAEHAHSVT